MSNSASTWDARHVSPAQVRTIDLGGTSATFIPDGTAFMVASDWFLGRAEGEWEAVRSHTLVAFGDAFHAPIEIAHPDWHVVMDRDPVGATEERRRILHDLAAPGVLGFGGHFGDVTFGQVSVVGDQYSWSEPVGPPMTLHPGPASGQE